MKTFVPGAARRRETADAARGRLSQLFTGAPPFGTGEAALLAEPVPAGGAGPPAAAEAVDGTEVVGGGATLPVEPAGLPPPGDPSGDPPAGLTTPPPAGPTNAAPAVGPTTVPSDVGPSTPLPAADRPEPTTSTRPGARPLEPSQPQDTEPVADDPPPRRLPLTLHPALVFDRRAVLGLSLLLVLAVGYAVQHFWLGRPQPVPIPAVAGSVPAAASSTGRSGPGPPAPIGGTQAGGTQVGGAQVVVDVAGDVQNPGLRTLPGGSRVADALRAAGGAVPGADTDGLNLARVLTDGEQVLVGGPPPAGSAAPAGPLSLNRATTEQLDTLPGVGPTLAQRIVQYRLAHGPFSSLDELRQVGGIGPRKFDDIKPLLTL
ncbi:helix-hairpin-helix domain-containing protein [Kitasatospora sp. NPDC048365]|uniref:helix-hairpin-helix domain-containing protein n=1 Tax=Kitasatospora sp. NPDC048365 TaxID=3364050 RepID=UPI0037133B77